MKGMTRIIITIVAISFLFAFSSVISSAVEIVDSGECGAEGDNVTWTLDDKGTLILSGSGNTKDYERYLFYGVEGTTPFLYNEKIKTIIIQNGITSIGNNLFSFCPKVTTVLIPDSVKKIGFESFHNCPNLTDITIPGSVENIGGAAFCGCESLVSVRIPSGIAEIEDSTFESCTSLTSVMIPNSVNVLAADAFYYTNLKHVYYEGDEAHWIEISIAGGGRDDGRINIDTNPTIHYNSSIGADSKITVLGELFTNDLSYYATVGDSTHYYPELAHLMMTMANAAYDPENAKQGCKDLGLSQWEPYNYDKYWSLYGTENVCYSIGSTKTDEGTICLLINIRGSGSITDISQGTLDWLGNFNLESALETGYSPHKNFNEAAQHVYDGINQYLDQKFDKRIGDAGIVYFVTGHSRGGAVGNLVEYKLAPVGKSNVFGYNFAVPDTAKISAQTDVKGFNNIFNVSNLADPVSYFPGFTLDVMTGLKQIFNSGRIDNKWRKWGTSVWFDDGKDRAIEGEAHDPNKYVSFLRARKPLSAYTENPKFYIKGEWKINPFLPLQYKVYATYCPVDVELVDHDNKVIASVINDEIDYHDSHFGDVIVTTVGDQKMFAVPPGANYTLRMVGTDNGTMDYYTAEIDMLNEEIVSTKCFQNVTVSRDREMTSIVSEDISVDDTQLFAMGDDNRIVQEILPEGQEVAPVITNKAKLEMLVGDKTSISAESNDEYQWHSENGDIATVENGTITAVSAGTAGIVAETVNGARAICIVTVIEPISLKTATISGIRDKTYTGKPLEQSPVVKIGETELEADTDYTLSYNNNISTGEATVIIKGKGKYTDSVSKTFKITAKKVTPSITLSPESYTYDGKAKTPSVAVKDEQTVLQEGTDYTISYAAGRKNTGKYQVMVTLKGNYSGSASGNFTITKAANPLKIKAKTARVKYSAVKKKVQTLEVSKLITFTRKGQGTMTYKKATGNKKIIINKKTGKVTVKKGLQKGKYNIKVKVKAAGNSNYKASDIKTVTFTIIVK